MISLLSRDRQNTAGSQTHPSDFVLDTSFLQILLTRPDPCDFGVSIYDSRDGIVVDVSVTSLDHLDGSVTCR